MKTLNELNREYEGACDKLDPEEDIDELKQQRLNKEQRLIENIIDGTDVFYPGRDR